MKKPINTKLHGLLDYMSGFILLLPWIVSYFAWEQDTWILTLIGFMTITMSLITDYELSPVKLIPMPVHLFLDVVQALVLIAFPFVFPLYHYHFYWPVILGVCELMIVALSSAKPYTVTKKDLHIVNRH